MTCTTRDVVRRAWLALLFPLAVGCAHAPTQPFHCDAPPSFHVTFRAAEHLNPDESGNALPTVVRLFQLSSLSLVANASFDDLWRSPKQVLGADLLRTEEVTVDPGQTGGAWFVRDPGTQYVVAMGVFRRPAAHHWRAEMSLSPVAAEQCVAQATPRSGPPLPTDVELGFLLDGDRIDALPARPQGGAR